MLRKNFPGRKKERRLFAQDRCDHASKERDTKGRRVTVTGGAIKNGRCTKCGKPEGA